jgi:hypothetical protein
VSPRILDLDRCRHCQAELERPTPRVCPACGGSLQKRHLAIGCLTSAPPPVLLLALLLALGAATARSGDPPSRAPGVESARADATAPTSGESARDTSEESRREATSSPPVRCSG